jgi:predicted ATPase
MSYTVTEIAAAGYRSLRAIRFPLRRLSVFVGANGAGKTNLYRALQLIQAAAAGNLSRTLAAEGGMDSALWAGKRQARRPPRIKSWPRSAMPMMAAAMPRRPPIPTRSRSASGHAPKRPSPSSR